METIITCPQKKLKVITLIWRKECNGLLVTKTHHTLREIEIVVEHNIDDDIHYCLNYGQEKWSLL